MHFRLPLFCQLIVLALLLASQSAWAQDVGRWGTLKSERGIGQGVCLSKGPGIDCLALRCGTGRSFELAYITDHNNRDDGSVQLAIDGKPAATLLMRVTPDGVAVDLADQPGLVDKLKAGTQLRLSLLSKSFPLKGAGQAITKAVQQCEAYDQALAHGREKTIEGLRLADETSKDITNPTFPIKIQEYADTDIYGSDLEQWSKDPLATHVTLLQCRALCSITGSCQAYTYNSRFSTCILKSGIGKFSTYKGATTGVFQGSKFQLPPPPTTGESLSILPAAGWRADDTVQAYYERLRATVASSSGNCELERKQMSDFAQSFSAAPTGQDLTVGHAFSLGWEGNTLTQRLPVWLVVSTQSRVRFSGKGFYALAPGGPAPFGIAQGKDGTRAIAALYARGSGENGALNLVPLEAGALDLDIALVGYLRGCQQEVVLSSKTYSLVAAPDAPEVVLATAPVGTFDTAVALDSLNRRLLISADRYRIETLATRTEIATRQGRSVSVSPTRRFLSVLANDHVEVVDVIDGAIVAELTPGTVNWAMNDAFVFTDSAPWAKVSLASTLSDGVHIDEQLTGPSCCLAGKTTKISVNLENNLIGIWGSLGYRLAALQNDAYSIEENPGSGFASDGAPSIAMVRAFADSIGPVAPIAVAPQIDFVGGISEYDNANEYLGGPRSDPTVAERQAFLTGLGLDVQSLSPGQPSTSVGGKSSGELLARAGTNAREARDTLVNQFSRIGLPADSGLAASVEAIGSAQNWAVQSYASKGAGDLDAAKAMFDRERTAAGYTFKWVGPGKDAMSNIYCEYVDDAGPDELPNAVDLMEKIDQPGGNIWVVRVSCMGGPTMGTQLGKSRLLVFDLSRKYTGKVASYVAANNDWFAGTLNTTFYDYNFKSRLFGRRLVMFGPGAGNIGVFDLDSRKFDSNFDTLANGDLLSEIYALSDNKHFVALGRDDSLEIFDGTSGDVNLSGRIVDDEIVVWNRLFQFDSTAEGASFVELKFPGSEGEYNFELFGQALRVPDLAARTLNGEAIPAPAKIGLPPNLQGSVAVTGDNIVLSGKAIGGSAGLKRVLIYQDGVLSNDLSLSGAEADISGTFARLRGARWASVVAEDTAGFVSLPINIDLGADPRGTTAPRLVAVGIDYYQDERIGSLNYAKSDVETFLNALQVREPGLSNPAILTDRRASAGEVVSHIQAMADSLQPGEHGVLFIAGHGLQAADGTYYLGLSDTNIDDLATTALPWTTVADAVSHSKGQITVLIDACHAGAAASSSAFATNDQAAAVLERASNGNLTIIAASKGRELSGEAADVGGGVFTNAIARVLTANPETFDTNGNGALEATELYAGAKQLVVSRREGLQTPWMSGNALVGNYAIF